MNKIAVRVYTHTKYTHTQERENHTTSKFHAFQDPPLNYDRVLVFDTETTTDQNQNVKFGFFKIYQNGMFQHQGLFFNPITLNDTDINTLKAYAKKHDIPLYPLEEFVDDVFYQEVFHKRTLCVGFNLAFDISRIAAKSVNARKNNRQGFTVYLSKNPANPPITIQQIGNNVKTCRFSTSISNQKGDYFTGFLLDVQTLAEVLLQAKHLSLDKVGQLLDLTVKKTVVLEHGKVTPAYIAYNIRDVDTTYEAYKRLMEELKIYDIGIPPTKIFSSA